MLKTVLLINIFLKIVIFFSNVYTDQFDLFHASSLNKSIHLFKNKKPKKKLY